MSTFETSVAPPPPAARTAPSAVHELKTLVLSRHPAIAIETTEEERADQQLAAVARETGLTIFEWTVTKGLVRMPGTAPTYGSEDPTKVLGNISEVNTDALFVLKDFAGHFSNAVISRQFRELLDRFAGSQRLSTFVLLGAKLDLPADVEAQVVRYELDLPTPEEYRRTIAEVVESLRTNGRAEVHLEPADYDAFTAALTGLTLNQARQALARAAIEDGRLHTADLDRIVELKAHALRNDSLLEYFPAADNAYEIGGFDGLRRWLDRGKLALSPQAAELNIPAPKGLMLVGVQGCGKSLAAKFTAREWRRPLLKLDASRLYDKYIGESERNMRRALATAEAMAPVVLWIDEIEKGLGQSSSGGEGDGGVSKRLFGTFLTWMQEKSADVFVVATANDISALPPELMRKGRFDEIFFVDLPDAAARAEILRIHLELRKQDPAAFDVAAIAAAAEGFSGAELEQVVITSVLRALHEQRATDSQLIIDELAATVPLSRSRREDVDRLRAFARERFVPVS